MRVVWSVVQPIGRNCLESSVAKALMTPSLLTGEQCSDRLVMSAMHLWLAVVTCVV